MTIYRSVKVVLQNGTNECLTVQGAQVLRGQWTDKLAATPGQSIPEQSAIAWSSESVQLVSGTSAFVRLGSLQGYTTLSWSLPWVGQFQFTANCPPGLSAESFTDDRRPDAIVVSVALRPTAP